jgi:hypothetical protein
MADDSLIEEMRAALRDDREHARLSRPDSPPPVAAVEPVAEPSREPEPVQASSPRWWAKLGRRRASSGD